MRPVTLRVSNEDTVDRSALDSIFIACGNLLVLVTSGNLELSSINCIRFLQFLDLGDFCSFSTATN